MKKFQNISCDIFCNVIDNYGDIGVCWRLARQLANEYELSVRLWVDDLASFAKLCPQADFTLESQLQCGVEVCVWHAEFMTTAVADIVIEAFACKLPESYIAAMVERETQAVWINLEYLSAEDWVAGCHKLPSPHPRLPLTKYFFFPGFTKKTGGLLLEKNLLARRDAFQNDGLAQQKFWQSLGLDMPDTDTLKVSLFAYENTALSSLFDVWANGLQAVLCLVPEGRILAQVEAYFGQHSDNLKNTPAVRAELVEARPQEPSVSMLPFDKLRTNGLKVWHHGYLQVRILPFVAQQDYDTLLWACDVNFVRGEDSCVRAQWAGKPFVWQIYAQHDDAHLQKLQAFLQVYRAPQAMRNLCLAWNGSGEAGAAWQDFIATREQEHLHAQDWAQILSENNLTLNLLDFCAEIGTIHAFKIEGQ